MDRISAYALLSEELDRWRTLPRPEVVAQLDKSPTITSAQIGSVTISIEVIVRWADPRRTKLRVEATAFGPSHWKMERLEETIVLDPLDSAEPRPSIGK